MKLPRWYLALVVLWLIILVPFWWFAAAFNDEPFFSLPTFASASEGAGWQVSFVFQLIVCGAMITPLIALPFAIFAGRHSRTSPENNDNA